MIVNILVFIIFSSTDTICICTICTYSTEIILYILFYSLLKKQFIVLLNMGTFLTAKIKQYLRKKIKLKEKTILKYPIAINIKITFIFVCFSLIFLNRLT